ncbi:DUF1223 domain-containing protein [Flavobacterium branchiicola]|uniref:DUF1223 domain-containing protein n=1 Tax=Flavobacterium branchiicola TaxID=1114875 RepID=A0ABV9PEG9_9FLAO|nr:DUF1223 domain-containing protein [Flavobacterium branchiicola]MBS7254012.1 DUF1223 domain-containing protein [Flavobacterium branchiicola]
MKKRTQIILAIVLLCLVPFLSLFPNEDENRSGHSTIKTSDANGFAVVELFTSEGCSSCPPADELIAQLKNDTSGKQVYLLVYHVDYWDRMGWKDKFSNPAFTARQQQYKEWLNLQTIYTPQFVVNGTSEFPGSNENELYNLVSDGLQTMFTSALEIKAEVKQQSINVSYKTNYLAKDTKLIVALIQKNAISQVERGENKGRKLQHVQIVNDITRFALDKKENNLSISKPENFNASGYELIAFTQNELTGAITSASKTNFN